MYRLTSATVDEGEWSTSHSGRFNRGKEPPVPIGSEAVWTPEPVWMMWRRENS
jgi:hypothetical protein